jgi:yecA family protein
MEEIYEPINQSLQYVGALMEAAEAHGILCGLLCTSKSIDVDDVWLRHVLSETAVLDGLASECEQQLRLVKDYTLTQLNSPDCSFKPLLPDDEVSLPKRIQALGGWCEGFLFGFGLTNVNMKTGSDSVQEFINDVVSISQIAPTESTEEHEQEYMQVFEYLRMGVIHVYEERHHFLVGKGF